MFGWLHDGSVPVCMCQQHGACRAALGRIALMNQRDVLSLTALDRWNSEWSERLCGACEDEARREHAAGRQVVWKMLPELFGLPEWELLSEMEEVELSASFS